MMEPGRTRVTRALAALAEESPAFDTYSKVTVGPFHRPQEVAVAKDSKGYFHVVIELPKGTAEFDTKLGDVLPAEWITVQSSGARLLDVTCADTRLVPTFATMVGEMLDRIDVSGTTAVDELSRVLESWRLILAQQARDRGRNQVIGLFGELVILERMTRVDPVRALMAWRGKEGYRHDFYATNALEVKTYTTLNTPKVSIHGAYQLDPPIEGSLHLATFRVEETPTGRTIVEIVDEIVKLGVLRSELLGRSTENAPIILDDGLRLAVAEERLYEVTDDFPGVRASRLGEDDLKGVESLRFALMLDACPGRIDYQQIDDVLAAL